MVFAKMPIVKPGDRFVKRTGYLHTVWVVDCLIDRPEHPPHARLARVDLPVETITVAVAILGDPHFFQAT